MSNPVRPRIDAYGNALPDRKWQGMTLDDLLSYAQSGDPTSTVDPGQTGYGLDEVGEANTFRPGGTKKSGFDWKRMAGAALIGSAATRPGEGFGNVGRGLAAGTEWTDSRDQNTRRNALTDAQLAYSQTQTDLNALRVMDHPEDRARAAADQEAQMRLWGSQTEENRTRIAAILSGERRADEMQPFNIDAKRAQAENSRETAGRATNREDWIANRAAQLMGRAQYDDDGHRTSGMSAAEAMALANELWHTSHAAQGAVPSAPRRTGGFGGVYTPPDTPTRGVKTKVSPEEYAAIVEDSGPEYAAQHFTAGK